MNKEKALKNQGLEFREDINNGGGYFDLILRVSSNNCVSVKAVA